MKKNITQTSSQKILKPKLTGKIAFLIAGGTAINPENPLGSSISSQETANAWLQTIQPLFTNILIDPVFFYDGEGLDITENTIVTIAKFITKEYHSYDGFVITSGMAMIPRVASALAFFLNPVGKPVVVTGTSVSYYNTELNSQLIFLHKKCGDFGAFSNILGACQVALSNLGEVCVVYGNKILWPTRLVPNLVEGLNFFDPKDILPLGRVDFGIQLFAARPRRYESLDAILTWNEKVAEVDVTKPIDAPYFCSAIEGKEAIILTSFHGEMPYPVREVVGQLCEKIPVILYTQVPNERKRYCDDHGFIWMEGITLDALAAKTMWALGQEKIPRRFAEILFKERAQEFFDSEKE